MVIRNIQAKEVYNQTCGGFGRVCATRMYRSFGHVEFPKYPTEIFVELKIAQAVTQMFVLTMKKKSAELYLSRISVL